MQTLYKMVAPVAASLMAAANACVNPQEYLWSAGAAAEGCPATLQQWDVPQRRSGVDAQRKHLQGNGILCGVLRNSFISTCPATTSTAPHSYDAPHTASSDSPPHAFGTRECLEHHLVKHDVYNVFKVKHVDTLLD